MLYKHVTCPVQVSVSCNPNPNLRHGLLDTAFQKVMGRIPRHCAE